MIKVALSGINGRMGQMLLKAVLAAPDMELSAALGHSGSSAIARMPAFLPGSRPALPSPMISNHSVTATC